MVSSSYSNGFLPFHSPFPFLSGKGFRGGTIFSGGEISRNGNHLSFLRGGSYTSQWKGSYPSRY
jgi:hypothetical protein